MIDPILIHNLFGIEWLNIHWYAVIIVIGIIAGILLGRMLARRRGYKFEMIIDLMLIALPLSIIGARAYYVAFEWERYAGDFLKMIAVWEGGLAIYGAVIGAFIAVLIFCKWRKVPVGDILDIGAPGLILGQAIGRWGNFVNQEAYGNLVTEKGLQWFPYAVYIEKTAEWHQATFFYESMWNVLVLILLLWYWKRARHKGNVFIMYLVGYGIGRFFIEGLRTDSLWLIPGVIRVSQLLSAVLVVCGIIYLAVMHARPVKLREYAGTLYRLDAAAPAEDAAPEAAEGETARAAEEEKAPAAAEAKEELPVEEDAEEAPRQDDGAGEE